MKEYQITVIREKYSGKQFYTAWYRRIRFLWRGRWHNIKPIHQPTFKDAFKLTH